MDSALPDSTYFSRRRTGFRLKRRKLINGLFARGSGPDTTKQTLVRGSVLVVFDVVERPQETSVSYQAGVTTNRKIKKAVDRNRIKRVLREAIASVHSDLLGLDLPEDRMLVFMLIYRSSSPDQESRSAATQALSGMITNLASQYGRSLGTT